ncbi:MAG: SUMF1/EgtB/PvdO family nonheme iron enzyme [Planctomycetes bacterium]|nr:SUMF1/EgtB/PvdO family nonheme iron enzyme [Planctomycetota bacterium]
MSSAIRWLHLTDLHWGHPDSKNLWPRVRQRFFEDLEAVLKLAGGPLDVVLFTGDLTHRGTDADFEGLKGVLDDLYAELERVGSGRAPLYSVPGNHDLVRPDPTLSDVRSRLRDLKQFDDDQARADFLARNDAFTMVSDAFQAYRRWLEDCDRVGADRQPGLLPEDFSATVASQDGRLRLGIAGLNSAFLQIGDGNHQGKLALEVEQYHQACGGDAVKWEGRHHGVLLVSHHPPSWLSSRALAGYRSGIFADDRIVAHLCGHLHVDARETTRKGGGVERRIHQAASLSGLRTFDGEKERIHGYAVGRLALLPDGTGQIRFWPRRAMQLQDGTWDFKPEPTENLDKADQGSPPEAVPLRTIGAGLARAPLTAATTLDLRPYLEWLVRRLRYVDVPGISTRDVNNIELDRVYVKLRIVSRRTRHEDRDTETGAARDDLDLKDVLPTSELLAITGEPGSGKTTLLRYVALLLARGLTTTDQHGLADRLGFEPLPPPLLFRLTHLAERLPTKVARDPDVSAWPDALAAQIRADSGIALSGEGMESLLCCGGLLVLLDGLDEVAGERSRKRLAAAISAFADAFPGWKDNKNRFVVACRTRAWGGDKAFSRFDEVEIQPLDDKAMDEFLNRWARTAGDPESVAAGMKAAVRGSPEVRNLAANPQTLTMLALVYRARKRLPEQRAILYDQCVEYLVERQREALGPWGKPPAILRHLQALARAMHHARDRDGARKNALGRDQAERLLATRLDGNDDDLCRDQARELLHALEVNVGLIHLDGPKVHFPHRTFQEYLIAKQIANGTDPAVELIRHLEDPAWAEVTALTAGVLAQQSAEERIEEFLRKLVGQKAPPTEWAPRVAAAAVCLKDLEAFQLPEKTLSPLREALGFVLAVLKDPKQRAPLNVRIQVAEGLGRTRDPRLEDDKRWIVVPEGPFWSGSERPMVLVTVSEFAIQRWAVTIAEFRRFVEDGGYDKHTLWSAEGWSWREENAVTTPRSWRKQLARTSNYPVVGVSCWEAEAFCRWFTDMVPLPRTGWIVRLPTQAEWEKAARGGEYLADGSKNPEPRREWPWVGGWDERNAAAYESRHLQPVGCHPAGHGPYGTWDQSGNVREWCRNWYGPYRQTEREHPTGPKEGVLRAARGGSFDDFQCLLCVSYSVDRCPPAYRHATLGFRCVAAPPPGP